MDKRIQIADLTGKTFGSWHVDGFESTGITARRGTQGGERTDTARRGLWLCRCVICNETAVKRTDTLTKQPGPIHRSCRTTFQAYQKDKITLAMLEELA